MRYAYPYVVEQDETGRLVLEFPDVPQAHTDGANLGELVALAEDALIAGLGGHVEAGRPIPKPTPARGRPTVVLPALIAAKLALHEALVASGETKSGLARRMEVPESIVRRLLDLDHRSHIGSVATALRILGWDLEVSAKRAA